jgi:hypothetical protein
MHAMPEQDRKIESLTHVRQILVFSLVGWRAAEVGSEHLIDFLASKSALREWPQLAAVKVDIG